MDIVQLEIQNLSTKDRKELIEGINEFRPKKIDLNNLDKWLESYFWDFPDEFIAFQKGCKYSLYNQTIQENDFKDFDYEDVIESLTQDQKDEIIWDICSLAKYLRDENDNDYADDPYIWEPTDEDWEDLKKFDKKLWEQYKNNKYILVMPNGKDQDGAAFFTDDDELILFALNEEELATILLRRHRKILDPHYKVNRWIERKYELKLAKKAIQSKARNLKRQKRKCN
ncbi:hypothetical protein [Mesomycoplasma ovipneumoniae]|uniref:hypothetical protein n=1 Tax=Mesomycoplasma ovipneumoniae TaxID=29562 RepID=UPI002964D1FD|nr:hypothetical protein [Mesomycoplasma ovipneumoniae]MDW2835116.1 hypothetical protein [Mesomycoplasma ovipneumoniae]MDW2890942.1 hypothetical protein [Mesomycoplasma ovipneumoniae]